MTFSEESVYGALLSLSHGHWLCAHARANAHRPEAVKKENTGRSSSNQIENSIMGTGYTVVKDPGGRDDLNSDEVRRERSAYYRPNSTCSGGALYRIEPSPDLVFLEIAPARNII
jgi:hypothetical protein